MKTLAVDFDTIRRSTTNIIVQMFARLTTIMRCITTTVQMLAHLSITIRRSTTIIIVLLVARLSFGSYQLSFGLATQNISRMFWVRVAQLSHCSSLAQFQPSCWLA